MICKISSMKVVSRASLRCKLIFSFISCLNSQGIVCSPDVVRENAAKSQTCFEIRDAWFSNSSNNLFHSDSVCRLSACMGTYDAEDSWIFIFTFWYVRRSCSGSAIQISLMLTWRSHFSFTGCHSNWILPWDALASQHFSSSWFRPVACWFSVRFSRCLCVCECGSCIWFVNIIVRKYRGITVYHIQSVNKFDIFGSEGTEMESDMIDSASEKMTESFLKKFWRWNVANFVGEYSRLSLILTEQHAIIVNNCSKKTCFSDL